MNHDQLWAPWRLAYVAGDADEEKQPKQLSLRSGADPHCFICRAVADDDDRRNLVVHRGQSTVTILNRYPYNNGHLLIAPLDHLARLDAIPSEVQLESWQVLARMVALIERLMKADGFNVGLNLGRVAGAGLPGHLHWHIVPRWSGDTNFMPVLAGVKVIPQSLDALWELLTGELQQGEETSPRV